MKPKIGIIICGFMNHKQFVSTPYMKAARLSGGLPLIIPHTSSHSDFHEYLHLCDGFLFCGGDDINPLLFGEEPDPSGTGKTHMALDTFQIHFMEAILAAQKPVLAICRGMQVMNVACGGTIYQDISLQPGVILNHMQNTHSRSELSHNVLIHPDTILNQIAGSSVYTNSYHHQTIKKLGHGLTVSGMTSDGTIEAIEYPEIPFALGVQWHPECMFDHSVDMRNLFSAFVKNCIIA